MLLPNGSAIHLDIIEVFNASVEKPENFVNGELEWNFVDADLHLDLPHYSSEYLGECLDVLADDYEGNLNLERIEILKKDFLGMEA